MCTRRSTRRRDPAIGHDTIEKPPFIMGPKGPKVIHVGYTPANVEQVYFPNARSSAISARAWRCWPTASKGSCRTPAHSASCASTSSNARWRARRVALPADAAAHRQRRAQGHAGRRIVALDNGMYKIWFARCYRTRNANALLLDNALATMGAGLPSAMMAAMLNPGKRVMAVCGDGGFMMNSQELETAVRLKLDLGRADHPGRRYGMIRWKQAVDSFTDFGLSLRQSRFRQVRGGLRRNGAGGSSRPRRWHRPSKRRSPKAACSSSRCRWTTAKRPRARRRAAQQGPRGGGMKTRAAVLREIGLPAPVQPVEAARDRGSRARAARP
jgi:hypothetical protein